MLRRQSITCLLLCAALTPGVGVAEGGVRDKLQSVFDGVARGINYVGQKAERFIGTEFGIGADGEAEFTETRPFNERYPVDAAPVVSISNEFGEIRVQTWEDRVVEVTAEIIAGADTAEVAAEVAEGIEVNVNHRQDLIEVRTLLPEAGRSDPHRSITVNYRVTIPVGATVITDNYFGDTRVTGVRGLVAVESQYGQVDLSNLSGAVKVRAHGEFPLRATALSQGGDFDLHGAAAEFRQIGGALQVSAFRGSVLVTEVPDQARIVVDADSGPVKLVLPPGSEPDLTATVLHGNVDAAVPLTRTAQGNKVVARWPNAESARQAMLTTVFGDITVAYEGQSAKRPDAARERGRSVSDALPSWSGTPEPGAILAVEAAVGDIQVSPSPDEQIHVDATRIVRVPSTAMASAALNALELRTQIEPARITVTTVVTGNMEELKCDAFRVDLQIQCPPTTTLEIRATNGLTSIEGIGGAVTASQAAGNLQARGVSGPLNLTAQNGGVTVVDATGTVEVAASYGGAHLTNVRGAINARTTEGRLVIDGPGADVHARASGGDIRVLTLEGVNGGFDIRAEQGDVSLYLSPEADVTLSAATKGGGVVHSNIPLDGSINLDTREFHGRLKDGLHRVRLEAEGGDIYID